MHWSDYKCMVEKCSDGVWVEKSSIKFSAQMRVQGFICIQRFENLTKIMQDLEKRITLVVADVRAHWYAVLWHTLKCCS